MKKKHSGAILDAVISASISAVGVAAIVILGINVWNQMDVSDEVIGSMLKKYAESNDHVTQIDHAALIGYMRASSSLTMKAASLTFSFLVILVGSLYIRRVALTQFCLEASSENIKDIFLTISQGLAVVVIGAILVGVSLFAGSTINYEGETGTKGVSMASDDRLSVTISDQATGRGEEE